MKPNSARFCFRFHERPRGMVHRDRCNWMVSAARYLSCTHTKWVELSESVATIFQVPGVI